MRKARSRHGRLRRRNVESGNLDYQARDMVALVARILVDGRPIDVYVTHLYRRSATIHRHQPCHCEER